VKYFVDAQPRGPALDDLLVEQTAEPPGLTRAARTPAVEYWICRPSANAEEASDARDRAGGALPRALERRGRHEFDAVTCSHGRPPTDAPPLWLR
jgi:hypothetical protein